MMLKSTPKYETGAMVKTTDAYVLKKDLGFWGEVVSYNRLWRTYEVRIVKANVVQVVHLVGTETEQRLRLDFWIAPRKGETTRVKHIRGKHLALSPEDPERLGEEEEEEDIYHPDGRGAAAAAAAAAAAGVKIRSTELGRLDESEEIGLCEGN